MKILFTIILAFAFLFGYAQSKNDRILLSNARILESLIFESKDKKQIEEMFSANMTKFEWNNSTLTKEEAIKTITENKSTYKEELSMPSGYGIKVEGGNVILSHKYLVEETKENNNIEKLDLTILSTWIKEKKNWKLLSCKIN